MICLHKNDRTGILRSVLEVKWDDPEQDSSVTYWKILRREKTADNSLKQWTVGRTDWTLFVHQPTYKENDAGRKSYCIISSNVAAIFKEITKT
jgi:hypothetical protein